MKKTKKNSKRQHDLKRPQMTSNDLKRLQMTSNENDKPVFQKVKSKNKLKGGDPNDVIPGNGKDLSEQTFSSQNMAESIEIKKADLKFQNEITRTNEKYNKKSCSTQSKIKHNVLVRREFLQTSNKYKGGYF